LFYLYKNMNMISDVKIIFFKLSTTPTLNKITLFLSPKALKFKFFGIEVIRTPRGYPNN